MKTFINFFVICALLMTANMNMMSSKSKAKTSPLASTYKDYPAYSKLTACYEKCDTVWKTPKSSWVVGNDMDSRNLCKNGCFAIVAQ